MRKKVRLFLLMFFIVCMSIGSTVSAKASTVKLPIDVTEDYTKAGELLGYINDYREEKGKKALIIDSELTELAMQRAAELGVFMSHSRPFNGLTVSVWENRHKDDIPMENIACGQGSAAMVFSDWKGSPGHNATMSQADDIRCGVGCVLYNDTRYWTFIASCSSTPYGSNSMQSGVKNTRRTIEVDTSKIKFMRRRSNNYPTTYGDMNDTWPIVIYDCYEPRNLGEGYRVTGEVATFSSNTPDICKVTADGYIRPVKAGTGSIKVTLKADPSVSNDVEINVKPQTLGGISYPGGIESSTKLILDKSTYIYTGQAVKPKVTLYDHYGNLLKEGKDYTITYMNNTSPGVGTVICYGIGNYQDYSTKNFIIEKGEITEPGENEKPLTPPTNPNGSGTQKPPVTPGGNTGGGTTTPTQPSKPTQPTVPSQPSKPATPSQPSNPGISSNTPASGKTLGVKVKKSTYTYTGKSIKPTVTVRVKGNKKLAKKYYTISYKSNKNAGVATVTVKGKGKYKGYSGKAQFKIEPKKMTLSSVKSTKKKQTVIKWKKDSQASRYELQVSTNKKFKKAGTIKVSRKKTSYTAKGLKSKKYVYVRVRSVKDTKYGKLYGSWSSVKKIKVK